jgi:hypothetical protein
MPLIFNALLRRSYCVALVGLLDLGHVARANFTVLRRRRGLDDLDQFIFSYASSRISSRADAAPPSKSSATI